VPVEEPFKKLINQGMILGDSAFVYRVEWFYSGSIWGDIKGDAIGKEIPRKSDFPNLFVSLSHFQNMGRHISNYKKSENESVKIISEKISDLEEKLRIFEREGAGTISRSFSLALTPIHADVTLVNSHNELDIEAFRNSREEYENAIFISENGIEINNNNEKYIVGREVEKMSKSKYNVVSPDDICEQYGADTLRLYEMFLGPLEQAKPWNTAGITGVHGFLKKLWKLYHSGENESFYVSEEGASKESLKTLHKTIKKVKEDIENFSFNTSVSSFMIAVNELSAEKCNSKEILEPLAILISPYAPHIAEELWNKLGHSESISTAAFPKFEEKYLVESSKEYPISFNGKMRFTMELPLDLNKDQIESAVMAHEKTIQYLEGRTPKKVIIVPGKIVNIVG
jgi:leucyl-tRNA synthetase